MAKSKVSVSQYISNQRAESQYTSGGGNESPESQTDAERLALVEEHLTRMQAVLNAQWKRMAEMQAQIDRLIARPPFSDE